MTVAQPDPPTLRRLAVTTLLIVRPGGLTMADLADALGIGRQQMGREVAHLTDVMADLYQDDCPVGCDQEVCTHARLRLTSPDMSAAALMEAARSLGLVFREGASRDDDDLG